MRHYLLAATVLTAGMLTHGTAAAQNATGDDAGLWTSIGLQKSLTKQWNAGIEAEYRLQDDWSAAERFTVGLSGAYKPLKWLKLDAGYKFIRFQTQDEFTYKKSAPTRLNKWTPAYWGTRHRLYASVTGTWKVSRPLSVSLRERWQYTYRPGQTVDRYDVDGQDLDDVDDSDLEQKEKRGKGKNVLRSRVQAEYKLPKRTGLVPYVSVEMYNTKGIDKMRYTLGTEWKLNKHNSFDLGYRYQAICSDDDSDRNTHALLVGYKFKF